MPTKPEAHLTTPHARAVVHLDALAHNTALFANRTSAEVMAVVKADGFGHGAAEVAATALASGATWLGVTTCAEALHLRAKGITAPILTWLHRPGEDFGPALCAGVDISVSSSAQLRTVAANATFAGTTANVHLKVDTGLHRNGAAAGEWLDLVRLAAKYESTGRVHVRGVWSHLVSGTDMRAVVVGVQVGRFDDAVAVARTAGLSPELRHLANSAAALAAPRTHYELIRPGVGLYGVEPDPSRSWKLRGAMTLSADVLLVKRVPAHSGVSYEHDYVTSRESTLVLVSAGYADGVPFAAAPRAEVWLRGRRYPVAGRIAMDQFVADIGDDAAEPGDEVVVFGPGTAGEPTVAEWAEWAGTIPHEVLTGVGRRIPRRHVGVDGTIEESLCVLEKPT